MSIEAGAGSEASNPSLGRGVADAAMLSAYSRFRPARRLYPTLAFSPDGARLAYVDDGTGQFNVTVQAIDEPDGRTVTSFTDQTVRRVAWHPDGETLFLEVDTGGDENTQIFRLDPGDSQPVPLTDEPDTRFILAAGDPLSPEDGRFLAYSSTSRTAPGFNTYARRISTDEVTAVYEAGGRTYAGYWAPDGKWLTLFQYQKAYDQVVLVAATDGGGTRQLSEEGSTASYELGPWLPDGSGFLVRTDEGGEFLGLAVMDAHSGSLSWLDRPVWDIESVAAGGQVAVWSVNVDGSSQLRARNLIDGSMVDLPALPTGKASALTVSADGERIALVLSTPTRAASVLVIDVATGRIRWLTNTDALGTDRSSFVEPELIHYRSFDGRDIPAYLYLPESAATKPVGIVIVVHGGPTYQERPTYGTGFYQFLISLGIGVLAPNIRGSIGYGKAYQNLVYRDWGGGDLGDIAAAARYLQDQPWADETRIGLMGGSYGGFMVLSAIARHPEFNWAAAVAACGPTNLVTLAKATPPAYRALVAETIGDPEADFDTLMERSPVTYAARVRTPLLVLQGANDVRVPQSESDQFVARLREQGIDVRYDVYEGEGHSFMQRSNQMRADSDAAAFFASRLS
jgi:dipeptidyl aminopeptidase/acylaminoacyl peptidase